MKEMKSLATRLLSMILAAAMVVTLLPEAAFLKEEKVEAAETVDTILSDPLIEKDDTGTMKSRQKVTWDCVWFGSYPQTEVVSEEDTEQIAALEKMNIYYDTEYEKVSASKFSQIKNASYDTNGDAAVGTEKYRRIKYSDATCTEDDSEAFYNWNGDKNSYHYFKYERIKWRVLDTDGKKALLLADKALDTQAYDAQDDDGEDLKNVTWEDSSIRSFLNNYGSNANSVEKNYSSSGFLNNAFSRAEFKAIKKTSFVDENDQQDAVINGEDTSDKVVLLFESDVINDKANSYGFVKYVPDSENSSVDEAKMCKTTTYAYAMGGRKIYDEEKKNYACAGNCQWWILSSNDSYDGMNADEKGNCGYSPVVYSDFCVRPVLTLNLSSCDLYTFAGTVCSNGTVDENAEPRNTGDNNPETEDDDDYDDDDYDYDYDDDEEWRISVNTKNIILRKNQSTTKLKVIKTDGDQIEKVTSSNNKIVKIYIITDPFSISRKLKLVAGKKTGTATVKIYLESGLSASVKVKVQSGKVKTKKVKLPVSKLTLKKGKTYKLQPEITPITAQDKITYRSSNKKVASVNSSGKIKAKKKGTAKITVKSGKKKAVLKVKVK